MAQETVCNEVLHFTCDECQISLTVDVSLAGVTGPCPSCGQSITAPSIERKPQQTSVREASPANRYREVSGIPSQGRVGERRKVEKYRKIDPNLIGSASRRERDEVAAVAKMLAAGLLVLIVVLVVTYLLKQRFGP